MRETIVWLVIYYFLFSMSFWFFRAMESDCKVRYMDYVFPISRLHCEVSK